MATQNKKACTGAGFSFFWLREKVMSSRLMRTYLTFSID